MATIELELLPGLGIKRLLIGGVDVTAAAGTVQLTAGNGFPTRLQVELCSPLNVDALLAEGIVDFVLPEERPEHVVLSWLDSIDPAVIDAAVLERLGYGDGGSPITTALTVLKELANGS